MVVITGWFVVVSVAHACKRNERFFDKLVKGFSKCKGEHFDPRKPEILKYFC